MHFQIFLPNQQTQNKQALVDAGLADFRDGAQMMPLATNHGPGDQPGTIVSWPKVGAGEFGFYPERQEWLAAIPSGELKAGRYWVGFWKDKPLVPEDLLLKHATWGSPVILGDGRMWTIPTIQAFPRDVIRNRETGEYELTVQDRYHAAHFQAMGWLEKLKADEQAPWSELARFVESVLCLNYRLTPEVVDHLRLFNTKNIAPVLWEIIGVAKGDGT